MALRTIDMINPAVCEGCSNLSHIYNEYEIDFDKYGPLLVCEIGLEIEHMTVPPKDCPKMLEHAVDSARGR
jgi:hypothetical protein